MKRHCSDCGHDFYGSPFCEKCGSVNMECGGCKSGHKENEKLLEKIDRLQLLCDRQHKTILEDLIILNRLSKILETVRKLYYSAYWFPDRVVKDANRLWENVRDACGFEKGNSPKLYCGDNDVKKCK